jgi:hypothetical protein
MWARIWSVGSPAIAALGSPSSNAETAAIARTPVRARAFFRRERVVMAISASLL